MLKQDLILQIMNNKNLFKKNKLVKDELGGIIMMELVALRLKMNNYLIDNANENKKRTQKNKKYIIEQKLKFGDYKQSLEATRIEKKKKKKKKPVKKYKIVVDRLGKNHNKELIKNNKLILKSQQRFISKKHNLFPEVVNKIVLKANNKIKQSVNSIEMYVHERNEEIIHKREEIYSTSIIKQYKND